MFNAEYNVFGFPLHGVQSPVQGDISRESGVYHAVRASAQACGWEYYRVENKLQNGFPDIVLFRAHQHWFIEAKMLKKRHLSAIEDDLVWQTGQLDFMLRALRSKANYMLIVGHRLNIVAFYTGEHNAIENFPDFVRCI